MPMMVSLRSQEQRCLLFFLGALGLSVALLRLWRRSWRDFQIGVVCRGVYVSRCRERLAALGAEVVGEVRRHKAAEDRVLLVRVVSDAAQFCRELALDPLISWVINPLLLNDRAHSYADIRGPPGATVARVSSTSAKECSDIAETLEARLDGLKFRSKDYDLVLSVLTLETGRIAYGWGKDTFGGQGLAGGAAFSADIRRREGDKRRISSPVSRAYYKLDEALYRFGKCVARGKALDLGASPGGWTQRLAETCDSVLALDPGDLKDEVLALENVTHLRANFFKALPSLIEDHCHHPFDVVVTDMCLHSPGDAVNAIVSLEKVLRPGTLVVAAIKINTRGRSTSGRDSLAATHANTLLPYLQPGAQLLHLLAATRRERTLIGFWRGTGTGGAS